MVFTKTKVFFLIVLVVWSYFLFNTYKIYTYSFEYSETQSDVIIVLGTSIKDGEVSAIYRERINHSIYLYNKDVAKKIIFTGGLGKGQNETESSVAKKYALTKGIPYEAIITEEKSKSTYENFKFTKQIMDSLGFKTALVVSDPHHMKRAMTFANYYKMDCKPSPTKTSEFNSFIPITMSLAYETVFYTIGEVAEKFN